MARGIPEFLLRRFFPHNESMPLRAVIPPRLPASCCMRSKCLLFCVQVAALVLCVASLSPLAGKTAAVPALDPDYVSALAAADRLLQAWRAGDVENGMALLSSHAKQSAGSDVIEKFFSNSEPSAYEIERGKMAKRGRYEFPVVLVTGGSKRRARRRFSSVVVINTGNNDWAVDKLP